LIYPNYESENGKVAVMAVKISTESISSVGRIVQFHRKQAGLSRIALADIAGVGKTVVYDIEKGKETVRLNTLLKIFDVLNIAIFLDSTMMVHFEADDDA
jgi:HTH-type transcriptional regulator / antitoxin HipB